MSNRVCCVFVRLTIGCALVLSLMPLAASAKATKTAPKPTVYTNQLDQGSTTDVQIREMYSRKFSVVEIRDTDSYVKPRPIAGGLPRTARVSSGELLEGYVFIAYLITTEGRASETLVLKSADSRLVPIALDAMASWRFEPAQLDGTKVPSIAAQEFHFETQGEQPGVYQNPVDGRTYVSPGGWKTYMPQGKSAPSSTGKVHLAGVRLLNPQSEFAELGVEALSNYIKRVVSHAEDIFGHAKSGSVLVQFTCGTNRQEVKLATKGDVDKALLQKFHERLAAMERLEVKERELAFQIEVQIGP